MTSWTSGVVAVMWQGSCDWSIRSVRNENGTGSSSPGWTSSASKSIVRPLRRGGVPVLNRRSSNPRARSEPESPSAEVSPARPPGVLTSPVCIKAWRNVPVVTTTARARYSAPPRHRRPAARPSSTMIDSTISCRRDSPRWRSTVSLASAWYAFLSHWARGLCIAGPLPRLSRRNWRAVASVIAPIAPPSASTSRTICPLATPPIAGLQLIWPTASQLIVSSAVRRPIRADARAASSPAWPAPTTTTS